MFKIMKGAGPTLVREIFSLNEKNRYELQNHTNFATTTVNSLSNELESSSYLRSNILETLPLDLQQT